jgi:ribonuclease-3
MFNLKFNNPDLLKQAFIHRSYLNEHPEIKLDHNERLEFLGDAVLELVVTEFLFAKYPERPEGELTAFRAALVNTESLAQVAGKLGLGEQLLLSKGEAKDNGRARQAILADTFEAIVGALYLDAGYAPVKKFITENLLVKIDDIVAKNLWQDSKSAFQERAQAARDITPTYQVLSAVGPDHSKTFTVGLYLGEELIAEGVGPSKQMAEQEAARVGLEKLGWKK